MPAMSRKSKSANEKEDPTTSTPKIQKDGSGDEDEKDKFTGADQGSGDEDEVEHDGEVMLMSVDDDDTLRKMQRKMDNQLRRMEELEQQLRERSDIESGPPGTPPPGSPRPSTLKESPTSVGLAPGATDEDEVAAQAELAHEGRTSQCTTALAARFPAVKSVKATFGATPAAAAAAFNAWTTASHSRHLFRAEVHVRNELLRKAAAELNIEVTGLSATVVMTASKRWSEGTLPEKDLNSPLMTSVENFVDTQSEAAVAYLQLVLDEDGGKGAAFLRRIMSEVDTEFKAGVPLFKPYEIHRRLKQRLIGHSENSDVTICEEADKFLADMTKFTTGSLAPQVHDFFHTSETLRAQVLAKKLDHAMAGSKPLEVFRNRMPGPFKSMFSAGETAIRTVTKSIPIPDGRTERFQYFTAKSDAVYERALVIAHELDAEHEEDDKKRRAVATAQSKETSDKATKDKAAKDKAIKDKADKDSATKLRANAATFRRRCWKCGKSHDASTCRHTGKVCSICEAEDHLQVDCPEAGNGAAQAR